MALREQVIDFRARNNFTQAELAEKIGVSRYLIMDIENERRNIKPVTQRKIEIYIEKHK